MKATRAQLEAAELPLPLRDYCAHIAIPLAECMRGKHGLLPGTCHHEKHNWERCEWEEARRRMQQKQREDAVKKATLK